MPDHTYDIAIIGGGVNGCGLARDAAGRGLRVYLCERGDLASGTSSASTKLVHGGLRYLEFCEFRLVREALREREVLLRIAPHIVRPLRFVLPHRPGLRPRWLLRLGLFLYDLLGGAARTLPSSRAVDLARGTAGKALKPEFARGFEYSDCRVDDARLVVLNALDAAERGASINTRTECVGAAREGDVWRVTLVKRGRKETVRARVLVNAAGPWVSEMLECIGERAAPVRLVKGSHIVVPRLFGHERAYIFQNPDGRIGFAIPYEGNFTLIGTTDEDFSGDPADAVASDAEITYLCAAVSAYFRKPVTPGDVVWTYSGVRPLYDDGSGKAQETTRDYILRLEGGPGAPPLLNIYGGKITTYRRLAEHALDLLEPYTGRTRAWTAEAALPGGDFPQSRRARCARDLRRRYPFLAPPDAHRLVAAYGTRADYILGAARSMKDLGTAFGSGLTAAEVHYLIRHEWAETAEDVLWRRTKIGLRIGEKGAKALDAFMKTHAGRKRPAGRRQPALPLPT